MKKINLEDLESCTGISIATLINSLSKCNRIPKTEQELLEMFIAGRKAANNEHVFVLDDYYWSRFFISKVLPSLGAEGICIC